MLGYGKRRRKRATFLGSFRPHYISQEPAHDSGETGALPVIVVRPAIVVREASSFQMIRGSADTRG